MSNDPHAREQAIFDLLARDRYNMHELGESSRLDFALKRLAVVLGDQQPDYVWATVTNNTWTEEAGTLHVLAGNAVLSAPYGRAESHGIKVEPLALVDLDVTVRTAERNNRIPGGVEKVAVTLRRDNGSEPIELKAQANQNDDSVQGLLRLVRTLMGQMG